MTDSRHAVAAEMVERARAGDQNAMGMIAMVGENARAGDPRAQTSFRLIAKYLEDHPPDSSKDIGAEEADIIGTLKHPAITPQQVAACLCALPLLGSSLAIQAACVALSNGILWSDDNVKKVDAGFDSVGKTFFRHGFEYSGYGVEQAAGHVDETNIGPLCAGHCIGMARKIQMARKGYPAHVLGPEIGWELGCVGSDFGIGTAIPSTGEGAKPPSTGTLGKLALGLAGLVGGLLLFKRVF